MIRFLLLLAVAVVLALGTDYLVAAGGWWRAGAGIAVAGAAGWRQVDDAEESP